MDEDDLHAYMGLLILAGVYRSRGEARATMSHKVFHVYWTLVWFDDRESRAERSAADKPLLYNPGLHVTVDEQLVPFRGKANSNFMYCV